MIIQLHLFQNLMILNVLLKVLRLLMLNNEKSPSHKLDNLRQVGEAGIYDINFNILYLSDKSEG